MGLNHLISDFLPWLCNFCFESCMTEKGRELTREERELCVVV